MNLFRIVLMLPLTVLVHSLAFADQAGPRPDQRPPATRYPNPCDPCGREAERPPPPPFNPSQEYVCYERCAPPTLPYPEPPLILVVPVPPPIYYQPPGYNYYGPPIYYIPPIYIRPPAYLGPQPPRIFPPGQWFRPNRFHPGAAHDCEIRQNNNGQFELLSADGVTLYVNSSEHAETNVKYMKSYYSKQLNGLCGQAPQGNDAKEVGI